MAIPVLATKLYTPPPRPNWVERSHLIQRLENGIRQGRRLTLVSAPAGFGKTALISEWISGMDPARPVAWLSLDGGDNDPVQFLHYWVAALQKADPQIGQTVQAALQSNQTPPLSNLVEGLINDASAAAQHFLFVLDDYHLITAGLVHPLVQLWLERQPLSVHTILVTREDPPLPLPRLRARGEITEIRERDLRFSEPEAAAFLNQTMRLNLGSEAVSSLESRTEGWVAGLQLAAIALQEIPDASGVENFIATFAGSDRYIVDYLVSEVLVSQPAEVSDFLMETSILERMCAGLCDAVLYSGQRAGKSQEILDLLERVNMFIVPLDNRREWYRYHHLFADLLRQRLMHKGEGYVNALHQRAAEWFAAQGLIDEALKHALAAQNSAYAADLVNRNWRKALHEGRLKTVLKWIEMLPKDVVASSALLSAANSWIFYLMGKTDAVELHAANAVRALSILASEGKVPQDDFEYTSLPGQMGALQALIALRKGEPHSALAFAKEAIRVSPPQETLGLGLAWSALAGSYRELGDIQESIPPYHQALQTNRASGNIIALTIGTRHLIRAYQIQGCLEEAEELCLSTLHLAEQAGQVQLPAYGVLYVTLGDLNYERNQLEKARALLDQGLEQGKRGGYVELLVASGILEAKLRRVIGDLTGAVTVLEETYQTAVRQDEPIAEAEVSAWLARLQAETGNLQAAARWAGGLEPHADRAAGLPRGIELFSLARVLIALDRKEEALGLAVQLEKMAVEKSSAGRQIEALMLQAEIYWLSSNPDRAAALLEQALVLAEPRGFTRLFLDEGSRLQPILAACRKAVRNEPIRKNMVERLLGAFPDPSISGSGVTASPPDGSKHPQPGLIDPLSEREIEVLRQLALGLTVAEVARQLYLSPNTLKAHTQNIYSKLDVHNRVEAVNKARELGLI